MYRGEPGGEGDAAVLPGLLGRTPVIPAFTLVFFLMGSVFGVLLGEFSLEHLVLGICWFLGARLVAQRRWRGAGVVVGVVLGLVLGTVLAKVIAVVLQGAGVWRPALYPDTGGV